MTRSGSTLDEGLALGPLHSLVHLLAEDAGRVMPSAEFLDDLARELDAGGLAWLPRDGPALASRRFRPEEVDWRLVRDLAPGELVDASLSVRPRSPRLISRDDWEALVCVAGPGDVPGVLRVHATVPLALDATQLGTLAQLVAAVLERRDPRRAARKLREQRLVRRAAGLTHDLRNQLTLALMELERLRDCKGEDVDVDALERALSGARELCAQGLVGEGLELDEGGTRATRSVALRGLLLEEARSAVQLARRGARDVEVLCPPDARVLVDPRATRRALQNLLTNALEASPEDGRVLVGTRALPTGELEVTITDQGCGLDEAELARLFAPGRSGSGGTGYGTAGLFDALTQLDAELIVESEPGVGTRASVRLTSAPAAGAAPLLLVDADARRRARRARALRGWGGAIPRGTLAVGSARQGLRIARALALDAVVVARGTAGPELARLREHAREQGIGWHVLGAGQSLPPTATVRAARRREA